MNDRGIKIKRGKYTHMERGKKKEVTEESKVKERREASGMI